MLRIEDFFQEFERLKERVRILETAPRLPDVSTLAGRLNTFDPSLATAVDVPGNCSRSTTGFGDPTTGSAGPSVTVATGARVLVVYGATVIENDTTSGGSGNIQLLVDGVAVTNSEAHLNVNQLQTDIDGFLTVEASVARGKVVTGLTPGDHTFKLEYRSDGDNTVQWYDRWIAVLPL
jgi:hypothetical protein